MKIYKIGEYIKSRRNNEDTPMCILDVRISDLIITTQSGNNILIKEAKEYSYEVGGYKVDDSWWFSVLEYHAYQDAECIRLNKRADRKKKLERITGTKEIFLPTPTVADLYFS